MWKLEAERLYKILRCELENRDPGKVEGFGRYRDLAEAFLQGKRVVPRRTTDSRDYEEDEYPSGFYSELRRSGSIDDSGVITDIGKRMVVMRYLGGDIEINGPVGKVLVIGDDIGGIIVPKYLKTISNEELIITPLTLDDTHSMDGVKDEYVEKLIDLFGTLYPRKGHLISSESIEIIGDTTGINEVDEYEEVIMPTTVRDEYGVKHPAVVIGNVIYRKSLISATAKGTCEICGKDVSFQVEMPLLISRSLVNSYIDPLIRK